jgi:hypothetical protein
MLVVRIKRQHLRRAWLGRIGRAVGVQGIEAVKQVAGASEPVEVRIGVLQIAEKMVKQMVPADRYQRWLPRLQSPLTD